MRLFLLPLVAGLLLAACSDDSPPPPGLAAHQTPPGSDTSPAGDPTPDGLRAGAQALAANVAARALTSCEAAARLYEAAGPIDDVPAYVAQRSRVLAGLAPSLIGGADDSKVPRFDDSGFQPQYRDGSNQVRHLAAAIQAGATLGPAAALLHRILRPDSPQDGALNDAGTRLGAALIVREVAVVDAGNWIRRNLCE